MNFRFAALMAVMWFGGASTALATAPRCRDIFSTGETSSTLAMKIAGDETLSQAIRSNAVHYWSYVSHLPAATPLKAFEKYEGIVVGDPHMGNFSVVPVVLPSGNREVKFVDIDFDDAGRGSYAFDFARYALTVKAADRDVKIKDLIEAYTKGLSGLALEAPAKVAKALSIGIEAYDQLDAAYVSRKTEGERFKIADGVLETYQGTPYSREQIAAAFPDDSILDVAQRPKERGGSVGSIRLWVLLKGKDGRASTISEIKGYQETSLVHFQSQKTAAPWFEEMHSVLWKGLSPKSYRLAKVGSDWVWIRSKKVSMFDVPYGVKSEKQKLFIADLSLFDANYLGLLHGSQPSSKAFAHSISKDPDQFREAVKSFVKDYLSLTKKMMN